MLQTKIFKGDVTEPNKLQRDLNLWIESHTADITNVVILSSGADSQGIYNLIVSFESEHAMTENDWDIPN